MEHENMSSLSNDTNCSSNNCPRNISTDQEAVFRQYYYHFIASVVVGGLICSFALASNIICLIAICTSRKLRHRGTVLVANLVVVCILLSLTVYPISTITTLYVQYLPLSRHFCDWSFYYYFTVHAFVWHECLLSLNRFIAIIVPHSYRAISSRNSLMFTIATGYLISFAINSYGFRTNPHLYVFSLPFGTCRINPKIKNSFFSIQSSLGVYLPMSVVGISYLIIFISIYVNNHRIRSGPQRVGPRTVQAKRVRLARMLFVSFLWNTLSYMPQPVITSFFSDLYLRHPPALFYGRYASLLGVAGNTVGLKGQQFTLTGLVQTDYMTMLVYLFKVPENGNSLQFDQFEQLLFSAYLRFDQPGLPRRNTIGPSRKDSESRIDKESDRLVATCSYFAARSWKLKDE